MLQKLGGIMAELIKISHRRFGAAKCEYSLAQDEFCPDGARATAPRRGPKIQFPDKFLQIQQCLPCIANHKITRLAKGHEDASEPFKGSLNLFGLEAKGLAHAPNCPADSWAQIAQAFVFWRYLLLTQPFGAADQICQQQEKDPADGRSILGSLVARPVSGGATPQPFSGYLLRDRAGMRRGDRRCIEQLLP